MALFHWSKIPQKNSPPTPANLAIPRPALSLLRNIIQETPPDGVVLLASAADDTEPLVHGVPGLFHLTLHAPWDRNS